MVKLKLRFFSIQFLKERLNSSLFRASKNPFLQKVSILAGGTVVGRIIMIGSLPIVTRIYTPYDFEILSVYISVLAILAVVSNLRFNMAITLPKNDDVAINLLALSIISALVICLILTLLVAFLPRFLSTTLGQPDFYQYEWMIPLGAFLVGVYQALQYWISRKHRFVIIAKTRISRAIGGVVSQLGLGFFGSGPLGLLIGHTVYSGFGIYGLIRNFLFNDKNLYSSVSLGLIKKTVIAYKRFPLQSVPEALANTAGIYVPVIIIASYAGAEGGYLALAMQVLVIPMAMVGQSVSQVFIAEAPKRYRDGTLNQFTRRTAISLFKIGSAILIPLGIIAPFIFPVVFGDNWEFAGVILTMMIPWHILQFIASPISSVLHVMGLLNYAMILQIFGAVLRIGSVYAASQFYPSVLILTYAISGAVFYLIYTLLIFRVTRNKNEN